MSRIEDGVGFPITAVDQFSGAFADLKNRVSGMHSEFGRLNGVIAGFTGGLGLAGFATFIKGAADAQDQIYKLSQKIGIAVGDLSTFAYAGKQSDVSAESLAKGVKTLSQKMIEAGDATSKASQLMKVMGVDARGQTLPAIEKMADVFKKLPDGPTKAALAVVMFGKAGMDMIPLLNQGSDGIRKLREEAERLGLKMNDETAKAAEQFNDNLRAVKASGEALGVTLLNATAPALVRISAAMKAAAEDGGVLKAIWVGMGGAMAEAFGLNDDPTAKKIKALSNEIADLQAKIAKGPADLGGGVQDRGFINQYIERVKVLQLELRAAKSLQDAMSGKFEDQVSRAARARTSASGGPSESTLAGILAGGKANDDALREAERLRQLDLKGWVAYAEAVFKEADETNLAMAKISEEYWKNEEKLRDEDLKGWVAYADSVFKEADELNLAMAKVSEDRNKEEASRWTGYINGIEGAFRQGWDAFTGGAKNAAQVARDALKRTFFDWLWQQFAKPFVLNIVASGAAVLGIPGLANAATTAAGGGFLSGVTSLAGSSIPGVSGIGEFAAGATGTFMGPAAPGSAAAMGADFAAFMTNPYTLAVLAVVAIAVAARARQGGPKEGGSFFGGYNASGAFTGGLAVPGSDNGRFFTPSGGDSLMRQTTDAVASGFYSALERLGGTPGRLNFGMGFDKDPRGSADSRVSALVTDAQGRTIYSHTQSAGRDDKDFETALGLETRRMMLAALQASVLPEGVNAILRMVDAASASAEDIDAILRLADAFGTLRGALKEIDLGSILANAARNSAEVFRDQGSVLLQLARRTSLTTDSLEALTQATNAYRQSAAQLILELEGAKTQIADMFGQTGRSIRLAGLDGQGQYDFFQSEAERLFSQISGANSAAEIQRITSLINQDINAAFALLSPDQQTSMQQDWLTRLDNVNSTAQERLTALQEQARDEANATLARIESMMTDLASAQQRAADTQETAANIQLQAAQMEPKIHVLVDVSNGAATVTDGSG